MRPVPVQPCMGLIHAYEGKNGTFEATRQTDPGGLPEIGWSHALSGPSDPRWDATLTLEEADALALEDLNIYAARIADTLGDALNSLTDGQFAAVLDFTYNLGPAAFANSTLCRLILAGNLTMAVLEFPKWVFGTIDGRKVPLPGLVRRRAAEVAVWNTTT